MNSIVIDIVIGLVFVYLLYSLLASILSEILATWLGMRARVLRQGIDNLLNDRQQRKPVGIIMGAIGDFFLFKKKPFKFTKAGQFYQHPSIKYLSTERAHKIIFTKKGIPAYIRKNTFSSVVIDDLISSGRGICDWDKIKFSLENNAGNFHPETLKQLKMILQIADDDMDVFVNKIESWYEEMMDRVIGWYKRKLRLMLSLIGLVIVVTFNVDTLEIIKILSNDKEARTELAQMAVDFEKTYVQSQIDTTVGDSLRMEALHEDLDEIKKDIGEAENLLGLGWNYGSLVENKVLTKTIAESKIQKQLIFYDALANHLNERLDSLHFKMVKEKDKKKKALLQSDYDHVNDSLNVVVHAVQQVFGPRVLSVDSITFKIDVELDSIARLTSLLLDSLQMENISADSIKLLKDKFLDSIKRALAPVGRYCEDNNFDVWSDSADWTSHREEIQKLLPAMNYFISTIRSNETYFRTDPIIVLPVSFSWHGKQDAIWYRKVGFIISSVLSLPKFIGLWLTIMALSMGAPFWFDLLKKLVSIKNVGVNGDEKTKKEESPGVTASNVKSDRGKTVLTADPVEVAIAKFRKQWTSIPGVIAVNSHIDDHGINKIKIVHTKNAGIDSIPPQVKVKINNDKHQVLVSTEIGEYALLDNDRGPFENAVLNRATGSWGTASGLVTNLKTGQLALLSCAHVLRSDKSSFIKEGKDEISIQKGNSIQRVGTLSNMILSNFIDAGVADIDASMRNALSYDPITRFRSVNINDFLQKTEVKIKKPGGHVAKGKIVDIFYDYTAFDLTNLYEFFDLIRIRRLDNLKDPLTVKGDSGSLIVDHNDIPIAILIGGTTINNTPYSLGLKLDSIFKTLHLDTVNS